MVECGVEKNDKRAIKIWVNYTSGQLTVIEFLFQTPNYKKKLENNHPSNLGFR